MTRHGTYCFADSSWQTTGICRGWFLPCIGAQCTFIFSRCIRCNATATRFCLCLRLGDWTFDERVAVLSMIPAFGTFHSNIISAIGMLTERFVQPNTHAGHHDLGLLAGRAATLSVRRNIRRGIVALSPSITPPAMIERCRRHIDAYKAPTRRLKSLSDIRDITIENASMVVLRFYPAIPCEPAERRAFAG